MASMALILVPKDENGPFGCQNRNGDEKTMQKKRWSDLKLWQRILIIILGMIQMGLFVTAWKDLNRRTPEQVNGSKIAWRAALFINTIGPLLYLTKGRK